jgi:probable HAF family extracellular repeat protein
MSNSGRRFLVAMLWISLALAGPGQAAAEYGPREFVDLHPAGWLSSVAVCVNNRGEAVGNGVTAAGRRAFLWSGGSLRILLPPGAAASQAAWVNSRGDVAGTAFDANGSPHAFLFQDGAFFDPTPGWESSEALYVGEDGTVTGRGSRGGFLSSGGVVTTPPHFAAIVGKTPTGVLFGNDDNVARMFVPEKGYLSLLAPGGESASPGRINRQGMATFSSSVQGVERAYVYSGGFMVFMTPPGWSSSVAVAINNLAEVAGYGDGPSGRRGFLRTGADYEIIAYPGWNATEALGVNDFGEVAGSGQTPGGETHAFLASPASVPTSTISAEGGEAAASGGGCSVVPSTSRPASGSGNADPLLVLGLIAICLARRLRRGRVTLR